MKAETANKISDALVRLDEGTYGDCFECGERDRPAAVARAAVRPSAARIQTKQLEMAQQRVRVQSRRGL